MYQILDNVLSNDDLELLRAQTNFKIVDTGYDNLLCKRPDIRVNNLLTNTIKIRTRLPNLKEIVAFLRRNKPDFDLKFRVHADRDPLADGQICSVAAVFYLYEDDSGTALFRHPEYGDRAKSKYVFTEDDGRWETYFKCPSKANRLFIYDAKLFHGRYPWQVTKDRTVVVKFLG